MSFLSGMASSFTKSFQTSVNDMFSSLGGGSIGSLGDIVFTASASKIETVDGFKRNTKARLQQHEIIGRKPIIEFMGPEGEEVSFNMKFNIMLGVNPTEEADRLRKMCAEGEASRLILNNTPIGENLWIVESIGETVNAFSKTGGVITSSIDVTLKEYVRETGA